jgi:hypothetical protein
MPLARRLAAVAEPVRAPLAIAAPLGRAIVPTGRPADRPSARPGDPGDRPLVAFRHAGRDVTPGELADTLARSGAVTGRLLVLVPDVSRDERHWERGRETTGATYAERLEQLLGWTPVHTRLDAGFQTAAGPELATLLQRLVDGWPVPVDRIVLLSAGGGGLVVRAACALRLPGVTPWTGRVSEVIGLGVPRYAAEPSRLASDLGRRLDEQLAGIVVGDAAFLGLEPATEADQLLIAERAPLAASGLGAALGRVLWWRHRRGGRPRFVVDLFPTAESFELPAGEPLTNRRDIHDALLGWLA